MLCGLTSLVQEPPKGVLREVFFRRGAHTNFFDFGLARQSFSVFFAAGGFHSKFLILSSCFSRALSPSFPL